MVRTTTQACSAAYCEHQCHQLRFCLCVHNADMRCEVAAYGAARAALKAGKRAYRRIRQKPQAVKAVMSCIFLSFELLRG